MQASEEAIIELSQKDEKEPATAKGGTCAKALRQV